LNYDELPRLEITRAHRMAARVHYLAKLLQLDRLIGKRSLDSPTRYRFDYVHTRFPLDGDLSTRRY
jgi:hypothetical protein